MGHNIWLVQVNYICQFIHCNKKEVPVDAPIQFLLTKPRNFPYTDRAFTFAIHACHHNSGCS